jgi:hypothetical protein
LIQIRRRSQGFLGLLQTTATLAPSSSSKGADASHEL